MKKPDWKPGDKLEVIEAFKNLNNDLPLGKVVEFVNFCVDPQWLLIKKIPGITSQTWYTRRFKKIENDAAEAAPIEQKEEKQMTFDEAYEQAKALQIAGRGRMSKAALIAAIAAAKAAPAKPAAPLAKPAIPTLGEELRNKVGNDPSTCSYAMEWDNGHRRFQVRDVCHARMRKSIYGPDQGTIDKEKTATLVVVALDVAGHYAVHKKQAEYKSWVEYFINRSPFASSFITKDVEQAMKEAVYLDVNKPNSQLVAAAMGLRQASEFPARLDDWVRLKGMGFSEKAAHAMCHHILGKQFIADSGGHSPFCGSMNWEEYISFFKTGFADKKEQPANKDFSRYAVFDSIAKQNGVSVRGSLLKLLGVKEEERWGENLQFTERSLFSAMEEIEKLVS